MITLSNALTAALAHLQTQGAGHSIAVPFSAFSKINSIERWCTRRSLTYSHEGKMVILSIDTTAGL